MADDASSPLLGPPSLPARPPPAFSRPLAPIRRLVSAPMRIGTCARATVLLSSTLLVVLGLAVALSHPAAARSRLAFGAVEDILCGRSDPALPEPPSPADVADCLSAWARRLTPPAAALHHPGGATSASRNPAKAAAAAAAVVDAAARSGAVDAPLPAASLGLVLGAGFGAGLFVLGAALGAVLCMRAGTLRTCVSLPLCWCSCVVAGVLAPVAMVAAAVAAAGGMAGGEAMGEVFVAGVSRAAAGGVAAAGSGAVSRLAAAVARPGHVGALEIPGYARGYDWDYPADGLPDGEFGEVAIDSLNLRRSIEVDAIEGVTFPYLDKLADPAAPAFQIPPYFVAKDVYYGVSEILEKHSRTEYVGDFMAALENFERTADSFDAPLPKDRTEDLRGIGRALTLATILVAPGNTSLLCDAQESLACRGFATGDCAKTGSDCLETALYVINIDS